MKNRVYLPSELQQLHQESRANLRKINSHATIIKIKQRDEVLAGAVKLVYDEGSLLVKKAKVENAKDVVALHATLQAVVAVLEAPRHQHKIRALQHAAKEFAPGKPSACEVFFGAVTLFLGLAMVAASVLGIPFTGGLSGFGLFAGAAVAAGGIALMTHGGRKHRLSHATDALAERVQARNLK